MAHIRTALAYVGLRRFVDVGVILIVAILYSVAWPTLPLTHQVPVVLCPVLAAIAVAPFLWVRTNPALGWALSAFGALVIGLAVPRAPDWSYPWQVVHLMVLLVLTFVVSVRATMALVAVTWVSTVLLVLVSMPTGHRVGWAIGVTAMVGAGLLIRSVLASRRQVAELEGVSDFERARRTVLEDKAKIARDLHDVVAHHMSMVVVAAQTAPYRLMNVSPEVAAEFDAIGATARDALNDVRGILGVLRGDDVGAGAAPAPTATDIVGLLESSSRSGVNVRWTVEGKAGEVSAPVGLVLYRIAQEAVANAARHAVGAAIDVQIDYSGSGVTLVVTNGSGRPATHVETTPGHGIAGMHDRAGAVDGTVTARPTPDGGFLVDARIPLSRSAQPATVAG